MRRGHFYFTSWLYVKFVTMQASGSKDSYCIRISSREMDVVSAQSCVKSHSAAAFMCFAHAGGQRNRRGRKTSFCHVLGPPFSVGMQGQRDESIPSPWLSQQLSETEERLIFLSPGCNLRFKHKHSDFHCNSERLCCLKRNEIMNKTACLSRSHTD